VTPDESSFAVAAGEARVGDDDDEGVGLFVDGADGGIVFVVVSEDAADFFFLVLPKKLRMSMMLLLCHIRDGFSIMRRQIASYFRLSLCEAETRVERREPRITIFVLGGQNWRETFFRIEESISVNLPS
jgi:hypothetical protein